MIFVDNPTCTEGTPSDFQPHCDTQNLTIQPQGQPAEFQPNCVTQNLGTYPQGQLLPSQSNCGTHNLSMHAQGLPAEFQPNCGTQNLGTYPQGQLLHPQPNCDTQNLSIHPQGQPTEFQPNCGTQNLGTYPQGQLPNSQPNCDTQNLNIHLQGQQAQFQPDCGTQHIGTHSQCHNSSQNLSASHTIIREDNSMIKSFMAENSIVPLNRQYPNTSASVEFPSLTSLLYQNDISMSPIPGLEAPDSLSFSYDSSLFSHSSLLTDLSQENCGNISSDKCNATQVLQTGPESSTPVQPRLGNDLLNSSNMPSPIVHGSNTIHGRKESKKTGKTPAAKRKLTKEQESDLNDLFVQWCHNSDNPTLFTAKSGTHTLCYQKVPRVYVSSENASKKTLKRRAIEAEKFREHTQSKLSTELKRMPKDILKKECQEAGITTSHMEKETSLALRTQGNFSQRQMELIQRTYKGQGVSHDSLAAQQKERQNILGDQLQSVHQDFKFKDKDSPFAIDGYVTKPAACFSVKSLKSAIIHRLNALEKSNKLTWHDKIPPNEIWLKLNGDKGGGSTKCGFQIVNVPNSNSPNNNVVYCAFEAPDSHYNLSIALAPFAREIPEIQTMTWNNLQLVVIGSGDTEFICRNEGHVGKFVFYTSFQGGLI